MSALHMPSGRAALSHATERSQLVAAAMPGLWRLLGRLFGSLHWRRRSPLRQDAAAEANQVRRMAFEVRRSDPRFADDLFAAADRHERLHG